MAIPEQRTYPVVVRIGNLDIDGRILINPTNGDAEWFYGDDIYPTLRSNKNEGYKWKPDGPDSFTNLRDKINRKYDKDFTESEVATAGSLRLNLDSHRRTFFERNAPQQGVSLGLIRNQPTLTPTPSGPTKTFLESPPLEDLSEKFKSEKFKNQEWLIYPETMNKYQDRIIITQFNYIAAKLNNDDVSTGSLQNRENQFSKQDILGTVTLPMPNELTETNTTAWGDSSLSNIAALLLPGGAKIANDLSNFNIQEAGSTARDTLGNLIKNDGARNRLTQFLSTNAAALAIKKLGVQVDPEAFITRATGAAINPNMELLFSGPKLRQFGFNFKMSPRSQEEAKHIRYIIKFFKKGMSPKRSTNSELSFFLGTPNLFKIKFKSPKTESGSMKSIFEIKTCALVSCNVNYTPDGFYAAYNDSDVGSQPVAVSMNLGFSELTPIFNDDYIDDSSIGPENTEKEFAFVPQPGSPNFIGPVPGGR